MHPNETVIHDYVDEVLNPGGRAEVDRHLEGCDQCRRLAADLREIHRAASGLKDELREPPVRAWARLERAIKLETGSRQAERPEAAPASRTFRPLAVWLAAAAVLILATVVGLRVRPAARPLAPSTTAPAESASIASADAAQAVEAELRAAEQHYTNAINGLEQITKAEQGSLDPGTAATLQKNLAVIDQAINESRAALRSQPASEPAQQSLMESFKAKIALLQDTVALINEMRKGNDAGAARIVSGLKSKGN